MLIIPTISIGGRKTQAHLINDYLPDNLLQLKNNEVKTDKQFVLLDESNGKIITVSDREFTYGAVITEMPPTFSKEALKAQAVACYTFFNRKRNEARRDRPKNLKGADFVVNTDKWQYYVSKEQMRSRWGNHFDEYYNKLTSSVDEVFGKMLVDEGEPILAVYHAISAGNTEKSCDVFGGDVKYLTAVPSPGDQFAPNYKTTAEFDKDRFKLVLSSNYPNIKLEQACEGWIGHIEKTPSGMVKSITIGSVSLSGLQVRKIFGLRSASFDLSYQNDKFIFNVLGYGHGVGMSQYGAEYMAKQGSDYKQILAWYYPNTAIQ